MIGRHSDIEVVAAAASGEEAVALFCSHRPDVTLMDLQLPGMSGVEAIRAIRAEESTARIIVLTMYHGDEDIYQALQAGATTYLTKEALSDELVPMLREVNAGGRPIPPKVAAVLATRALQPTLSTREIEVLQLLAKGMRNKEIAGALGISEQTAKVHVKHLLAKLQVNDRTAAVSVALERGFIHLK